MSLLGQYLLDQPSLDVDLPDIFVSPEEWTGFLQEVLETTVAAYLKLKQESTVRSGWEEDKFTIHECLVHCHGQAGCGDVRVAANASTHVRL